MKALTVRQSAAHLIMLGIKRVENRSRQTRHRGPLLIHAGKCRDAVTEDDLEAYPDMAFGALIGCVDVVACFSMDEIRAGEVPVEFAWIVRHRYTEGPNCWVLDRPQRFVTPIPWRGNNYLFDVPDEIIEGAQVDSRVQPVT